MTTASRKPLDETDPVVLQLLQLAAEVILAYPGTVPPGLYELCDEWAADLAAAINPHPDTRPPDRRLPGTPALRAPDAASGPVPAGGAAVPGEPGAGPETSAPAERGTDEGPAHVS